MDKVLFEKRLKELKVNCEEQWATLSYENYVFKNKVTYLEKLQNRRNTNKFISTFIKKIKRFPSLEEDKNNWRKEINIDIDNFINRFDLFTLEDKNLLLKEGLLECTEAFIDEAKKFDSSITFDNIGQGMRNVWIMNIIQLLLGIKVALTPSVFAYSMLYPYTDNYLDDNNISYSAKEKINIRFGKKLQGYDISFENSYEEKLFSLVEKIEGEFPRESYIGVYESLLAIHRSQWESIKLQNVKNDPNSKDILSISIEKGGSSVLADAYLVKGSLTREEENFFFGYGFLLQLCDDLQDGKSDYANGHLTLITRNLKVSKLDAITIKILKLIELLLIDTSFFKTEHKETIMGLISKNCRELINFAVSHNRRYYNKIFFNKIKISFFYTPNYMNSVFNKLKNRFKSLKKSYNGVATDKILLATFKDD